MSEPLTATGRAWLGHSCDYGDVEQLAAILAIEAEAMALRAAPVADTAGIDAAWQEAEAALPEGWGIGIQPTGNDIYEVGASPDTEWRSVIREIGLAAALLALAAALRTPKPEGERP